MPNKKKAPPMQEMLFNAAVPMEHRVQMFTQALLDGGALGQQLAAAVIEAATAANGETLYKDKLAELELEKAQLAQGPLRPATYIGTSSYAEAHPRARVTVEDGSTAYVTLADEQLAGQLRRGDRVLVDAQGKALLFRDPDGPGTGEEARLERTIDEARIEVTLRGHENFVFYASARLAEQIAAGEVEPGRTLLVDSRQEVAFEAIAPTDGLQHYVYLANEPVPNVVLERDVGDPPSYIGEAIELLRMEMTDPDLCRRYELYRCTTRVLAGPTGTGKTHSIHALWREVYKLASEVTGVPIDQLPPRVMRLRTAEILDHWLGGSEKNLSRFFDEVEQLAGDPFVAPDGKTYTLPALVILEEIDGLARSRGHEPIYDRILTTYLQRLDTSRVELRDKLILFVATTNVAHQVDPAFLRRVGGTMEHFGRLKRRGFAAVLGKLLGRRPLSAGNGNDLEARHRLVAEVTAGLYAPEHADRGEVELQFAGSMTPVVKYRRDFLSGSVVQTALQRASTASCIAEAQGCETPGLTSAQVLMAIDDQVRSIVDNLHVSNVHEYTDVPDGVRIAGVRRLRRPAVCPVQLDGAA